MLRRKMLRDIWGNKGSYLACLVIAGIGLIVFTSFSIVSKNLVLAKDTFYGEQNFADGFIELVSMPASAVERLSRVEGIKEISGRVVREVAVQESLSPLGLAEERVMVQILPEIPENLRIAPGYKVEVTFTIKELSGVLVVPKTAVFTFQGEDSLFVVEKNRARVRKVTTGYETRQEVVITGGLAPGDTVILDYRTDGLDDGCRVRVQ